MFRTRLLGSMSAFQDNVDQYVQDICHVIYIVYPPPKIYLRKCLRAISCLGTECQSNPQELKKINTKGQGIIPKCCALRILHMSLILKKDFYNAEVIAVYFSHLAIFSEGSLPYSSKINPQFSAVKCVFYCLSLTADSCSIIKP